MTTEAKRWTEVTVRQLSVAEKLDAVARICYAACRTRAWVPLDVPWNEARRSARAAFVDAVTLYLTDRKPVGGIPCESTLVVAIVAAARPMFHADELDLIRRCSLAGHLVESIVTRGAAPETVTTHIDEASMTDQNDPGDETQEKTKPENPGQDKKPVPATPAQTDGSTPLPTVGAECNPDTFATDFPGAAELGYRCERVGDSSSWVVVCD